MSSAWRARTGRSTLQFAWPIALHILLPAFTVGLASFIAVLDGAYFFSRAPLLLRGKVKAGSGYH